MAPVAVPLVIAVMIACVGGALVTTPARAARIYRYDAGAPVSSKATTTRRRSPPRSPSGPPLASGDSAPASGSPGVDTVSGTGAGLGAEALTGADASSSAPSSGGDPLVENGLGSPLCGAGAGGLSAASRRNCATSGFEAAGAPTGNYALDVHIDTGALGFTAATLEQDYLVEPVWMGLVWIVHTLVVALEWCFTLDLLDSSAMSGVERALRDTQAAFTRPWLVLALALASLAAAYNGLVRRRVAETLGQAALMLTMMACGLWVIADPAGTVGALGRLVDAASVGTLGAVVEGTPVRAPRTLADSMSGLFAGVVGVPWCYLEFGDVRWCVEPALLDRPLRAAALRIAAAAQSADACSGDASAGDAGAEAACQALEGEHPRERAQSATLLRAARTNGELFLALPADAAARNSINDRGSLLSVLCGGSTDATDCQGPTAPEAEFRTQGGTASRVGGLLLIALGALGMMLLLGFIALHLLGSELVGLLYLLLAPAAVIAPALGDGGRAAFRAWATRLVGAVVSKLLFSFLLGVVLLLTRTLLELYAFGWWTRWLLVSAMWWGSYSQRRRVLGFVQGDRSQIGQRAPGSGHRSTGAHGQGAHHPQPGRHDSIARRMQRQFESPLAALQAARWVRGRVAKPAPSVERRQVLKRVGLERARAKASKQAKGMLEDEHERASAEVADAPSAQAELGAKRNRLQRVNGARRAAVAAGDTRRASRLEVRARGIEGEVEHGQKQLDAARRTVAEGERARRRTGRTYTHAAVGERSRFLDAQAALPASGRNGDGTAVGASPRRDYAALASLAGYGREQYERLDPRHQREARREIDRELALRRELGAAAGDLGATRGGGAKGDHPPLGPRDRLKASREFDRALERRLRESGHGSPRSRGQSDGDSTGAMSRPGARRSTHPHDPRSRGPRARDGGTDAGLAGRESAVMRDAHEVAQRRKRQLGA